ncbi:hypothetical protein [Aureibaculum conchae]|uniref:hypothetical protein n=1 Tax=Aureibaculum sp. 2308TA14-22 TaxID=3108392 RepID=UPI003397952E
MNGKIMKYNLLMIMAFLGMLLSSCLKSTDGVSINTFSEKSEEEKQTSKNLVADLPMLIDSTNYIVFSIRDNKIQERKRGLYKSGNWYNNYLDNLIFQNIETQETHILTKKEIKIISYERLLDSLNPSLNTTLYQIIDSFPKNEKEETFTSLYLSTNDGKNFTKITKENENLHGWKYIPETNNIYFITNNDLDGNRKLNDKDGQSIHSISVNDFIRTDLLVEKLETLNN